MRADPFLWGGLVAGILLASGAMDAGAAAPEDEAAPSNDTAVTEVQPSDDLLMRRERYFYSSFARRDPFASLIRGSFASIGEGDLLDIGELSLVGVVWGDEDKFAVVQDRRDHVHVLRTGDRIVNGKVIEITKSEMTVQHYFFGESANVTIKMKQGEGYNETR